MSASEALREKHAHLASIVTIAQQFQGKIVDMSNDAVIVEMTGKTSRVDAFLKLVRPYGILEAARSGTSSFLFVGVETDVMNVGAMVMPRAPIVSAWQGMADEDEVAAEVEAMDSSLLPPG